jgi:hypothetical protein
MPFARECVRQLLVHSGGCPSGTLVSSMVAARGSPGLSASLAPEDRDRIARRTALGRADEMRDDRRRDGRQSQEPTASGADEADGGPRAGAGVTGCSIGRARREISRQSERSRGLPLLARGADPERAHELYARVLESLEGLERTRIQKRMAALSAGAGKGQATPWVTRWRC